MDAMAVVRTPRDRWIEEGLSLLAAGGPDAVRVEPLAARLGVTKGGFDWHFADRPALLAEMLDRWEQVMVDEVIDRVEAGGGDERERIASLFGIASGIGDLLKVELAIRDWARRDDGVAARLRRVDNRRVAYMRSLFAGFCTDGDEVEARCLIAMTLFVGHHFVAADDHDGRTRREALELVLTRLLA